MEPSRSPAVRWARIHRAIHDGNSERDAQTASVNTPLPDSLTVVVVGSFYEPIENETVTWSVVSGGGSLSPLTSQTNLNGVAWTRYTAGATAGAVKIQAKVSSLPAVFFDATVTP